MAIQIAPEVALRHAPIIPREDWIESAVRFIEQSGAREFLDHLLACLEGDYVRDTEGGHFGYK